MEGGPISRSAQHYESEEISWRRLSGRHVIRHRDNMNLWKQLVDKPRANEEIAEGPTVQVSLE